MASAGRPGMVYLALSLAQPTGDGAVERHVVRIGVALVFSRPRLARVLKVLALWGADSAADWAHTEHVRGVRLALAVLRPRGAVLVFVLALSVNKEFQARHLVSRGDIQVPQEGD
jgi:hypothetical protein